uniref:C2H2-type domain-containing protein n=1 Tax=Trichobilharzia regenti TaxID=157069 RepID=A0AA85IQP5_TRIRE|nr:unnamed protein product [Trichobilharzia regenti]
MLYWSGLLLLHLNANANILGHCSISQSRVARSVLHEVIFPLFDYTDVVIADQCPFNPKYDIYAVHEQMKNKISDYDWECQMCGKRFYTEKSFDSHIGNRHKINAYSQSRTICLASYCPLLRCSVLKPDFAYGNQMFWDEALCETGSFSDISKQCEVKTSTLQKFLTAFILTVGLFTYYSVIFMRLSLSFCRLRVSSLSIPHRRRTIARSD